MTTPSKDRQQREHQRLRKEVAELRRRVDEAESTIDAIRRGEVDAVVVSADRDAVLTLEGPDRPYRLLVEHKAEPAAVLSCDGVVLACNGHFAHLLEQPPESLVGHSIAVRVPAERWAAVAALLESARQQPVEAPVELLRADGRAVPLFWSVALLREGVAGECLLVTDVTERRLADERRFRAEQFEALVNQAPLGIYLVNADFRIVQMNAIAQALFADIPGGAVGRDFEQVISLVVPPGRAAEVAGIFRRTLATGQPFETPQPVPYTRSGVVRGYLEWRLIRMTLPDGRFGLVCYISDVTAHVAAGESLRTADRRKDEFLAILAHELRNPLAPIRNALSVLNVVGSDNAAADDARKMMGRQVEQMSRLIDDLVDANRITRGAVELRPSSFELASLVHQAVATCRPLADRAKQEITVQLPSQTVYVRADPVRLSQVLYNVLHNACKFTPSGGRIAVTVERQGRNVVLSVKDNGIGIPPEEIDSIFEMFSQVRGPLEESKGGLGIGLALAKHLVELHGGTISARSEGPGTGTEFVMRLPIVTEELPRRPERRGKSVQAAEKRRILVVDDNRDNADSLATLLRLSGHDARVASDGAQAIEEAADYQPDVILLDIGLPSVNGYDACRRIREQPWGKRAAIFALTGWGQEEDRRKSQEAGFDRHFVKPVDHRELMQALSLPQPT